MDEPSPWSQRTKDLWFFGALALSAALLVYLFSPYLMVLLFAAVTVVVTWPVYQWVLARTGGRAMVASVLTTVLLFFLVIGPLAALAYLFVSEAVTTYHDLSVFLSEEQLETWGRELEAGLNELLSKDAPLPPWVEGLVPEDFNPIAAVVGPLQSGLTALLNTGANLVPQIIQTTVSTLIQAVLFVFAVVTFYMEGPRLTIVIMRLSPMDDTYELRLFSVFRQFANNMVLGSAATAVAQGFVAALGFGIAGVDRLVFLGILSAVTSFVPMVGTAFVWVPVAVYVSFTTGIGWGVFVAVWSMAVTGTVDNVLKPMFLRGSTNIHPILIFLAVFGGLAWLGIPGMLIGPVTVAFFLALYTIYVRDYLGIHEE